MIWDMKQVFLGNNVIGTLQFHRLSLILHDRTLSSSHTLRITLENNKTILHYGKNMALVWTQR